MSSNENALSVERCFKKVNEIDRVAVHKQERIEGYTNSPPPKLNIQHIDHIRFQHYDNNILKTCKSK